LLLTILLPSRSRKLGTYFNTSTCFQQGEKTWVRLEFESSGKGRKVFNLLLLGPDKKNGYYNILGGQVGEWYHPHKRGEGMVFSTEKEYKSYSREV
jgi:hypothetical protein